MSAVVALFSVFVIATCGVPLIAEIPMLDPIGAWPKLSPMVRVVLLAFWTMALLAPFLKAISFGNLGHLVGLSVSRDEHPRMYALMCVMIVLIAARVSCVILLHPF